MEKMNGLSLHPTEVSIKDQCARYFEPSALSTRPDASVRWSIASSPIAVVLRSYFWQKGRPSSHFTFLSLQVTQPFRERVKLIETAANTSNSVCPAIRL
jgi:hypothetical protein